MSTASFDVSLNHALEAGCLQYVRQRPSGGCFIALLLGFHELPETGAQVVRVASLAAEQHATMYTRYNVLDESSSMIADEQAFAEVHQVTEGLTELFGEENLIVDGGPEYAGVVIGQQDQKVCG